MERLKDSEAEWGPTRIQFAEQHRREMRQRARDRREGLKQRVVAPVVVLHPQDGIEVFTTRSGILAYRRRFDTTWYGEGRKIGASEVSLPFVSILGRATRDLKKEAT